MQITSLTYLIPALLVFISSLLSVQAQAREVRIIIEGYDYYSEPYYKDYKKRYRFYNRPYANRYYKKRLIDYDNHYYRNYYKPKQYYGYRNNYRYNRYYRYYCPY